MNSNNKQGVASTHTDWWLGMADLATIGTAQAAALAERMHLAIADETFQVLNQVPVVRNVSQPVRTLHHGIARLCYRSVGLASVALNGLVSSSSDRQR